MALARQRKFSVGWPEIPDFFFQVRLTLLMSVATTNATYSACGLPTHDIESTMIAIPATFGTLAIIFVLLRVYARLYVNKFFAWDDKFIVAALVCSSNFSFF
jgi:hypothetical protein